MKRLAPTQPGALKLARRFGEALVCVRYRRDADDRRRYTTVELIVDAAPVKPRRRRTEAASGPEIVAVRMSPHARPDLRARALARGATWDPIARLWLMTRQSAAELGLLDSIAENKSP